MTGNCRPEAEQLAAAADGAEKAMSKLERGEGSCHPARGLGLPTGTVHGGANDTATTLERPVQFAQCTHDNGGKDFLHSAADAPLVDTSQLPSAPGKGAHSIPGFQSAADRCTAIYSGERGLGGQ